MGDVRVSSYRKPISVKTLVDRTLAHGRGERSGINYNHAVQRGVSLWKRQQNSLLIHSILMDYPVGQFIFLEKEKGEWEGLDGKQRTNALVKFLGGEYSLSSDTPVAYTNAGERVIIAKKRFSDLPAEFRSRIEDYSLDVYCLRDVDIDSKIDFFRRINSGKSVMPVELTRIQVKDRQSFVELSKHGVLMESVKNTEKLVNEDIVEDIFIVTYKDNPSLDNKKRSAFLAESDITDEQVVEITKGLDYVEALFKSDASKEMRRKVVEMRRKTHLVMLTYMGILASRDNMPKEVFVEKAKALFNSVGSEATVSDAYNRAASRGSSRAENVRIRMDEIKQALR